MTVTPDNEPTSDERVAAFRMELTLLGVTASTVGVMSASYQYWLKERAYEQAAEAYRQSCTNKARANNDK